MLKIKTILVVIISSVLLYHNVSFAKKFNDESFEFFDWKNPSPCFAELGLNLDDVSTIIGDSQLLISHNKCDVELWTSGENKEKKYQDIRFVSSLTIFNMPRQQVIDAYMNFENYPKYIPQYTEGGIIKNQGNQLLVRLQQIYNFVVISLRADFRFLYNIEKNGDYSALLLDGDVGAGVKRIEFIPLSDHSTLVVNTSWLDLESARFMYRTILKAQPDFKITAPIGSVGMETEQIRTYLENINKNIPENITGLPIYPDTPIYAKGSIPSGTLKRMSDMGTLTFIHPDQWVNDNNKIKKVKFVTAITQVPGSMTEAKPISSDFARFHEYFRQAKKVVIHKDENGIKMDWYFKFGLGFISVGMNYTTLANWQNENTVLFERVSGDIDPCYGAWEWMDYDSEKSIVVFSVANRVGEEASWALRLANKIPNVEVMSGIFMSVLIVEKQSQWMKDQIKGNTHDKVTEVSIKDTCAEKINNS